MIYNTQDSIDLQNDVNSLICREKQWPMEFHPDKCKLLRITNMHKQKIDHVDEAKYLGILIHKKLSWKSHINSLIKKVNQTRGILQRNVKSCNRDVKAQCYQTYVRPLVEYASSVWDPVGEGNPVLRNKLKMVQRQVARFVYNEWRTTSSPSEMIKGPEKSRKANPHAQISP